MKGKDIVSNVGILGTMLFKLFIFAAVLFQFSDMGIHGIGKVFIALCGILWVLGLKNLILLYMTFKN